MGDFWSWGIDSREGSVVYLLCYKFVFTEFLSVLSLGIGPKSVYQVRSLTRCRISCCVRISLYLSLISLFDGPWTCVCLVRSVLDYPNVLVLRKGKRNIPRKPGYLLVNSLNLDFCHCFLLLHIYWQSSKPLYTKEDYSPLSKQSDFHRDRYWGSLFGAFLCSPEPQMSKSIPWPSMEHEFPQSSVRWGSAVEQPAWTCFIVSIQIISGILDDITPWWKSRKSG
jgi:hypothetical protein